MILPVLHLSMTIGAAWEKDAGSKPFREHSGIVSEGAGKSAEGSALNIDEIGVLVDKG
jgi:hypothetical protein